MPNLTREAAFKWLEDVPVLDGITSTPDVEAIKTLIGHEGFSLLLGLLMGSRQAYFVALANLPLGNSADAARLSVLQGKVQGIDLIRETLLEQFPQPAEDKEPK